MRNLLVAIVVSGALMSACVEAPGDTGDGAQLVSRTGLYSLSCPSAPPDVDSCHAGVGAFGDDTCALTGVSGSLVNGVAYLDAELLLWLTPNVSASAACFTPAPDYAQKVWKFGAAPTYLGSGPNLQCVLDGVDNGQGMQLDSDYVAVWRTRGGLWYLGGDQHGLVDGFARAHCFQVSARLGTFTATSHGFPVTQLLASNAQGGVVCALTKLGGRFTSIGDRTTIAYDAPSQYWTWTLTGRKTAEATCFR